MYTYIGRCNQFDSAFNGKNYPQVHHNFPVSWWLFWRIANFWNNHHNKVRCQILTLSRSWCISPGKNDSSFLGLMMMINKNTRMLQCRCFLAEMHKKCACKNNSNHPPTRTLTRPFSVSGCCFKLFSRSSKRLFILRKPKTWKDTL